MARPTSYTEEHQALADNYLEVYQENGQVVPSIEGLSLHMGVPRRTLYYWEETEVSEEFLHTFERVRATQASAVLNKGLTGDFNSTIAKLILHGHGHSDKQEIEHSGEVTQPELKVTVVSPGK